MLCTKNTSKGKTPTPDTLERLKEPKPPYISSLKIIELLHFWKIWGPSEEIYNPQYLWITLYVSCILYVIFKPQVIQAIAPGEKITITYGVDDRGETRQR